MKWTLCTASLCNHITHKPIQTHACEATFIHILSLSALILIGAFSFNTRHVFLMSSNLEFSECSLDSCNDPSFPRVDSGSTAFPSRAIIVTINQLFNYSLGTTQLLETYLKVSACFFLSWEYINFPGKYNILD